MGRYKVTGPRPVFDVAPGAEFERELSHAEEGDLLSAGRIALVPRRYQVIGASRVYGAAPGEFFVAAFRAASETALLDGGHIERAPERSVLAPDATATAMPARRVPPKPKED